MDFHQIFSIDGLWTEMNTSY